MLEQSLWKCLFLWYLKLHFFLGSVAIRFWHGINLGLHTCARETQHKNTDCFLDSDLFGMNHIGEMSEAIGTEVLPF